MALFYAAKIAALLHDPAWKPWIVDRADEKPGRVLAWRETSRPLGEGVEECEGLTRRLTYGLEAHELDALAAVIGVIPEDLKDVKKAVVGEFTGGDTITRRADRLAASFDRWMLIYSRKAAASQVRVPAKNVKYVNPLEPKFKIKSREDVDPGTVCRYVRSVRELFNDMRRIGLPLPLQYNILYMLLEPLWYLHCRECVPLADTRTPTHTVFDHVYATASMVNWVWASSQQSPVSGFFVKIDVAGIQKFISASRKVRDLWAGSWLVSALAWTAISDAVKLLGADIVLSPYIGANHFYIASILEELKRQLQKSQMADSGFCRGVGGGDSLLDCVESIVSKAYLWMGAANQPIVPGTFFLALPCLDENTKAVLEREIDRLETVNKKLLKELVDALAYCDAEGVERYFREMFREAWGKLARAVVSKETLGVGGSWDLARKLRDARVLAEGIDVDKAAKYLEAAAKEPPLHLRVTVVPVEDVYRVLQGKLKSIPEAGELAKRFDVNIKDIAEKLLFTYLFSIAMPEKERRTLASSVSVEPGFAIASTLEDVTESGFEECTVCSGLPAVIHVHDRNGLSRLSRELGVPRSFFTSGELLCPYCLYRRLLTLNKVLLKAMENLGLYTGPRLAGNVYPRPPSTCELAAINALAKLADKLVELRVKIEEEFQKIMEKIQDIAEEVAECEASKASKPGVWRGAAASVYSPLRAYVRAKCEEEGANDVEGCVSSVLSTMGLLEDMFDISCLLIAVRGLMGTRRVGRCVEFYCGPDGRECSEGEQRAFNEFCRELFGEENLFRDVKIDAGVYYAIVRGDGDYFGSRVVRGVLADYKDAGDYVQEVLNAIGDSKAREKLSEELVRLAEKLSKIALKLGLKEPPRSLVTPAYYTALSRGQMVTAITDSMLATLLVGFPVYAGGDDVAVLVPSYVGKNILNIILNILGKAEPYAGRADSDPLAAAIAELVQLLNLPPVTGFVGGEIAYITRLNYWGMLQPGEFQGFHRTPIGAVYPAPAAYGRSYGLLVTHYRDPFQAAWRSAGALEKLKDSLGFKTVDCKHEAFKKDTVFIAYGRVASLAGTPFQVVPLPNRTPVDNKTDRSRIAYMVRRALDLASETAEEGGAVSKSVFADFASECRVAAEAARMTLGRCDPSYGSVALKLAEMLAERNVKTSGKAEDVKRLVAVDAVQVVPTAERDEAEKLVVCGSFTPWLIVHAARYIAAGRR